MAQMISINERHGDLEFLISWWRKENHMFVAAWGESVITRECHFSLTMLPMFGDTNTIVLDEDDKEKFKFLNDAFLESR